MIKFKNQSGQGIVEYLLILTIVIFFVISTLTVVTPNISAITAYILAINWGTVICYGAIGLIIFAIIAGVINGIRNPNHTSSHHDSDTYYRDDNNRP